MSDKIETKYMDGKRAKVGDLVVCRKSDLNLVEGHTYTVSGVWESGYIDLTYGGNGWFPSRFELVNRKSPSKSERIETLEAQVDDLKACETVNVMLLNTLTERVGQLERRLENRATRNQEILDTVKDQVEQLQSQLQHLQRDVEQLERPTASEDVPKVPTVKLEITQGTLQAIVDPTRQFGIRSC